MNKPMEGFIEAAGNVYNYDNVIIDNISILQNSLNKYHTKKGVNTPIANQDIQDKFDAFLKACNFNMTHEDFKDLLMESTPRDDGSEGWHHQLSQVLMFLSLVQDKTISLKMLEEYGGLETAIRTALRHDSIEDTGTSFEKFKFIQIGRIKLLPADIQIKEYQNLEILMKNLKLMTKKIAILDDEGNPTFYPDGRMIKRDLFRSTSDYIHNMLDSEDASPVVWILKTFDGTHNLGNMIGAPKFTASRRLKYANEREDMYGGRDGLPELAMHKWDGFSAAIKKADSFMGAILYANFNYLEYVDQPQSYKRAKKFKDGDTIRVSGIGKYLSDVLIFNLPRGLNPLHTMLDTIIEVGFFNKSKIIRDRTTLFLKECVKPALKSHASHFPAFFLRDNDNNKPTPAP